MIEAIIDFIKQPVTTPPKQRLAEKTEKIVPTYRGSILTSLFVLKPDSTFQVSVFSQSQARQKKS
jgi:hypothetical protein